MVADNAVIQKVRYSQMFFFFFLISVTVASGFFFVYEHASMWLHSFLLLIYAASNAIGATSTWLSNFTTRLNIPIYFFSSKNTFENLFVDFFFIVCIDWFGVLLESSALIGIEYAPQLYSQIPSQTTDWLNPHLFVEIELSLLRNSMFHCS